MSERPWFPFYPASYFAKTRDLSVEQHGVYIALLAVSWIQPDCSLPNDMMFIRGNLPQMHGHTFNRLVLPLLKRFFFLDSNGRWRNRRLTEEWEKTVKLSIKQKQNVGKRWSRLRKNKDLADTTAIPLHTHIQRSLTQSTKPREAQAALPQAGGRERKQGSEEGELARIIRLKGWKP